MPYIFRLDSEPEGVDVDLRADESWSPVVSYDGSDVVESIPCVLEAATDDAMAAQVRALHRIQENVRYYVNEPSSQHTQETWLEWQMLDESSTYAPRRRLVKAMEVAFDSGAWFTCGEGNLAPEVRLVLTLRCAGWWEGDGQSPFDTTLTTTLMEAIAFPGLRGDAPGRVERIWLRGTAGPGMDNVYGAYVACRSEKRHGTLANFVPVWELELGTANGADTSVVARAGASGGNVMATDFTALATMSPRVYLEFTDVTANFSDNYGRYVVLYRGQVDAATTSCVVQVDLLPASATIVGPEPLVEGVAFRVTNDTTWQIFDTGLVVQLPPSGTHTIMDINELYGFTVNASRESVAGTLYSDCLILVPVDEYMLYYRLPNIRTVSAPGEYVATRFFVGPDGSTGVYQSTSGSNYVVSIDIPYEEGDGAPPGDLYLYFLIFNSPAGANTLTSDTTVDIDIYPRYHSLQGAS